MHVDDVDGGHGREVAQALQRGSDQARAAVAVVEEAQLGRNLVPVRGRARQQRLDLAVDGVAFSLLVGAGPPAAPAPEPSRGSASLASPLVRALGAGWTGRDGVGSKRR